jgi:hypothetical protein
MTDIITTAPITTRRITIPHLRIPNLGFAAALETLCAGLADAYSSVYAAPFNGQRRLPPVVSDEDRQGRDPSW